MTTDDSRRKQDQAIVFALRTGQWELGNVADALWAGEVPDQSWQELLTSLAYLRDLVRMRSGDTTGPRPTEFPKPPSVTE